MSSIRLGEIGKISMCKRILKSQTNEFSGIPFYKISTFGGTPTVYIDEKIYREYKEKYSYPKKGDILISAAGTIGKTVIFDGEDSYFQDSNIVWIENDESKVTNQFLYYFLQTNPFITTNGSTIKRLYNDNLRDTKIPNVPSIQQQNQITDILGALDKKIQINNQINQELEAMAKTLYDYWFVQFDFPDQNGKPYKSSGGKMVYNPELKREIPEGWGVASLFDVAEVQYGYPFSTDYFNSTGDGVPVIRIRDILGNDITNYSTEEVEDKYKINVGDVLIGMDGNFHMNYWIQEDCYLNQRVVKVNSDKLPNMVLKYQIEPFIKLREKSVSRTTVGHLSDKDLKAINVILPKEKYLSPIFERFENILKNIIINQQQNQELTQLRDWLLPMLMNGQVRVE